MAITFSLGISALLADPADETPGGYCRDELLFAPLDFGKPGPDFEIREVLGAHLPMASGSDDDEGDLVVIARDGVGGPLRPEAAAHLLGCWRRVAKEARVEASLRDVGLTGRALLVADPFPTVAVARAAHPLDGVTITGVSSIKDRLLALGPAGDLAAALAILRLATVHDFAVSVVGEGG